MTCASRGRVTHPAAGRTPVGIVGLHDWICDRRRSPHPDRPPAGWPQGPVGRRPRWRRHQGRAREGRRDRRAGRLRDHGPGHPGRCRADHRPPGRGQGRHPDERPVDHHQQGVPVGPQRDRDGRPADPRRRARDRRRRRHGVDDPGAPPAAEEPRGLQVRRHRARRLDGLRRALRPVHRPGDDQPDRRLQRGRREPHARGAGRVRRPVAPARGRRLEERRLRRRGRPGDDPAAARATSPSPRTRASAATRPSSRSPACARSPRTAPSPPAPPRRSPTAPAPWS